MTRLSTATKRQNINRNFRLHLRNDRKNGQDDFKKRQDINDTHFVFYCTLSSFDQWHHTRHILPHDRTLIRHWINGYRQGKRAVLKLERMPNTQQCVQMMTRLLVQHVKRTLQVAQSGTLVCRPISVSYP